MRVSLHVPTEQETLSLDDRLPAGLSRGQGRTAAGQALMADDRGRFRNERQRDRDRILYSSAFQRLGGVTQVSEPELGLTFHTRLTHSLKVAQVTRRATEKLIDQAKRGELGPRGARLASTLDPDTSEAAGMAHDLGHPPFGHVAEQALDAKAQLAGGFEGNAQTFRIITRLSIRSPEPGLSLTRRTLNGCLKYPWLQDPTDEQKSHKYGAYGHDDEEAFYWTRQGTPDDELALTAHLMDWSDDLTFAVHDLDDFYRAGLVPLDRLAAESGPELGRFDEALRRMGVSETTDVIATLADVLETFPLNDPYEGRDDQRAGLRNFASVLITRYLDAVSLEEGRIAERADLVIDEVAKKQVKALKQVTWAYVMLNPALAVLQHGRRRMINQLFDWYLDAARPGAAHPELLPPAYQARMAAAATDAARVRIVTDVVAGLTEAAAQALFRRMSGIDPGTLLDAAARVL